MKPVYIYILSHPITFEVKYVGKTVNPKKRLNQHLYPDNELYISRWTRKLMKEGLKPLFTIIEECDDTKWQEREMFYIADYRSKGVQLANLSIGGDGNHGNTAWNKGKTGYKHPQPNANRKGDKNPCSKLTDAQVIQIRHKLADGSKQVDIVKEYSSTKQAINKIANNRTYKHLL